MDNKTRLNNLTDSLCPSGMHDAANAYKFSVETMTDIGRKIPSRDAHHAYHDFIAGWEAAMNFGHEELMEENRELHGIVMDLCAKLMVKRCDRCKGIGVDENVNPCSDCNGDGYINLPEGDAEQIISEIKDR